MLVAFVVHEVQLVHHAARLKMLERAIDRYAVQLGIFFFGELVKLFGVQVFAGTDQ